MYTYCILASYIFACVLSSYGFVLYNHSVFYMSHVHKMLTLAIVASIYTWPNLRKPSLLAHFTYRSSFERNYITQWFIQ